MFRRTRTLVATAVLACAGSANAKPGLRGRRTVTCYHGSWSLTQSGSLFMKRTVDPSTRTIVEERIRGSGAGGVSGATITMTVRGDKLMEGSEPAADDATLEGQPWQWTGFHRTVIDPDHLRHEITASITATGMSYRDVRTHEITGAAWDTYSETLAVEPCADYAKERRSLLSPNPI
jgi:hypothetical protein